jgi:NTE family protein
METAGEYRNHEGSVGLALSGGGSRAIAFHLGCFRALHERGVLEKVRVISAVSAGSVIAGMYAYSSDSFEEFHQQVRELLLRGLQRTVLLHLLSPDLLLRVITTNLISRPVAILAKLIKKEPPLRRWASRTDALERALQEIFRDTEVGQVTRPNLDLVLNACEMRTGTAFRFGNRRSGARRFGEIKDNHVSVAHAIACSAAYPIFLPAFDRTYTLVKEGVSRQERVIITDGGVYDNLGISCLEPGRDESFSLHSYLPEYIVCCCAGHGQFSGQKIPYGFVSRTEAAFQIIFRKVQDAALNRLHMHKQSGKIKGFVLPYLGQQDQALPLVPPDLVRREEVYGYPTDFAAMSDQDIGRLSRRGAQLTRILLTQYCPEL